MEYLGGRVQCDTEKTKIYRKDHQKGKRKWKLASKASRERVKQNVESHVTFTFAL